ncbi:MAG: glycosyltransferase [Bacteroidetes bacterium]|nr:glycosyltransferase [Bacteroidota bacterium]
MILSRNERNLAAAPNFIRVFSLTRGKYFKWLAHDDLILPGYIEKCVELLEKEDSYVLCQSRINIIDHEGHIFKNNFIHIPDGDSSSKSKRFKNYTHTDHFCYDVFGVVRKSSLSKTKLIESYIGSDRVLLSELVILGKVKHLEDPLARFRSHEEQSIRAITCVF